MGFTQLHVESLNINVYTRTHHGKVLTVTAAEMLYAPPWRWADHMLEITRVIQPTTPT